MSVLPRISGREAVAALGKAGFEKDRELSTGTLRAIIRQAGLTVDEFRKLL